jgi:predicted small secreted protein
MGQCRQTAEEKEEMTWIWGVVAGGIILLVTVVVIIVIIVRRTKQRKRSLSNEVGAGASVAGIPLSTVSTTSPRLAELRTTDKNKYVIDTSFSRSEAVEGEDSQLQPSNHMSRTADNVLYGGATSQTAENILYESSEFADESSGHSVNPGYNSILDVGQVARDDVIYEEPNNN